jgi:PASTA domain
MAGDTKGQAQDAQTGKLYDIVPEDRLATAFAMVSFVYLYLALGFFLWLLFDIWARRYTLGFDCLTEDVRTRLDNSPTFHSLAYAFIGGALGGVIAGLRSCIHWHCDEQAFGWRFVWKYFSFPWLGGTLALVVYAILGSGITIIGGVSFSTTKMLFAFAVGSLVGYGSPQVVKWLDSQVNRLFKVAPAQVPDVTGLTKQQAERTLAGAGLKIGRTVEKQQDGKEADKVYAQAPTAGSDPPKDGLVDITIASTAPPAATQDQTKSGGGKS